MLRCAALRYAMPCHATPRYATPRYATPRHAILYDIFRCVNLIPDVYLSSEEAEDVGTESAAHVPLCGRRVVQEPDLQGDQPLLPHVDRLGVFVGGPVPHVDTVAVQS